MKPVRSVLLFVFSALIFSACFDQPDFSTAPFIEFEGLSFSRASTGEDSLVVSVSFQDGDGDVGYDATDPTFSEPPYNDINFYTNKGGTATPVASFLIKNFTGYALGKTLFCQFLFLSHIRSNRELGFRKRYSPAVVRPQAMQARIAWRIYSFTWIIPVGVLNISLVP